MFIYKKHENFVSWIVMFSLQYCTKNFFLSLTFDIPVKFSEITKTNLNSCIEVKTFFFSGVCF